MVNETGQLYTIEGVAAALIMLVTAYLVVNATSVYTAGDTHISDMQLETMGNDALTVMGSPVNVTENEKINSTLRSILEDSNTPATRNATFRDNFLNFTNTTGLLAKKNVQFIANYTCMEGTTARSVPFSNTTHPFTGTEHPVKATKWMIIDQSCGGESSRERAVLVEVLMWID